MARIDSVFAILEIHAGGTPVAPQVYATVESWCASKAQRSKFDFLTPVRQRVQLRPRLH